MNKPSTEEAVSAMLDDALSRHEVDQLLEQLRHDPRESERMGRYGLIGMAMRGELVEVPSGDMAASIMASIRAELVAPDRFVRNESGVAPQGQGRRVPGLDALQDWLGTWRLPAFSMALAATVAGVAVLVIQPAQQSPDDSFVVLTTPQVPNVQVAAQDVAASIPGFRPSGDAAHPNAALYGDVQDADAMPDPYLVQHLTYAEGGPMTSMASSVRLVAYERP